MINPKSEYRNPKQFSNDQSRNDQNKRFSFGNLKIRISNLFRISDLEFRILLFCYFCLVICHFSFAEDFTYNSHGRRDPFIPLIGPGAVHQVKGAVEIKSIEDVFLEGIVYDQEGSSVAIINGMILKEGDQIGIVVIEKIEPKKVVLLIENNRYEVALGGEKGGE